MIPQSIFKFKSCIWVKFSNLLAFFKATLRATIMLGFLRKHQKYFFVIITIVIVTSFSFFGTYGTLGGNNLHEQVAFTTVTGKAITRGQLEEVAQFISTDQADSKLYGGSLGPNFLNDGVIQKDFLENGLAVILLQEYASEFNTDLTSKHAREAHYKPYTHPDAPFIGSRTVWNYFSPEILKNLETVQKTSNPGSKEALQAKIALYLAEKRLPATYLKQILYQQERQYNWLPHDENLDYQDLSLFGYHSPDDWFGSKFSRMIAQFIINSAEIAKQKGYQVTKEEALADLIQNARTSFKENQKSPHLASANPNDYMQQQLTRMRLDRTQAVNIWQQVMLFRRMFQDVSNAALVDKNTYDIFNSFANETTTGQLYQLPEDLRLSNAADLAQFETYLNAIAKRSKDDQAKLELPNAFLSADDVAKKTPELAHKRYLLEVARASKKALESKVTLKDTLNYEIADANWNELQKQFPELAMKQATSAEDRLTILDGMDPVTRGRVDAFARKAIVKSHPEWIDDALAKAPVKREAVSIRVQGESPALIGLKRGEELTKLLDAAPIGEETTKLSKITFDNENYYRLVVRDRSNALEVLTFKDARASGALDKILDQKLEPYYIQIRNDNPEQFQNSDKSWKSLEDVKSTVAERYFEPLTKAIKSNFAKNQKDELSQDRIASLRFYSILERAKEDIQKSNESKWIKPTLKEQEEDKLAKSEPLENQWKLEKTEMQLTRKKPSSLARHNELFALKEGSFSKTFDAPNGDLYFFHAAEKGIAAQNQEDMQEQIARARFLIGSEAEQYLLKELLPEIKAKKAISFSYTNVDETSIGPEEPEES